MARLRIKSKPKVSIKQKPPIKAGQTMPRNIGGALNAKLVATVRKKKNG